MAKKDKRQDGNVQNREIYARMNFLYQAANFLATLTPGGVTKAPLPPNKGKQKSCSTCGCTHQRVPKEGDLQETSARTGATAVSAAAAAAALPTADDLIAEARVPPVPSSSITTAETLGSEATHDSDLMDFQLEGTAKGAEPKLNRKARRQLEREQLVQARQKCRQRKQKEQQQQQQSQQPQCQTSSADVEERSDDTPMVAVMEENSDENTSAGATLVATTVETPKLARSAPTRGRLRRRRNRLAHHFPSLLPLSVDSMNGQCHCYNNRHKVSTTAKASPALATAAKEHDSSVHQFEGVGSYAFSRMARFYTAALREIGRKNVIRMDPMVKRTLCRRCDSLLIPGVSAIVRIEAKPQLNTRVTCKACGTSRSYFCMTGRGIQGDRFEISSMTTEVSSTSASQAPSSQRHKNKNPPSTSTPATPTVADQSSEDPASIPVEKVASPPVTDSSSTAMEIDG
ncbi:Ribonuclease P protein subunit p21 [Actinomortierella wolfii]|nr:Ribonuclease P protein subunit p21 [Actinomortierella wolfii]